MTGESYPQMTQMERMKGRREMRSESAFLDSSSFSSIPLICGF
jgi:hypothetical protein